MTRIKVSSLFSPAHVTAIEKMVRCCSAAIVSEGFHGI
jgi:hypothetical protein